MCHFKSVFDFVAHVHELGYVELLKLLVSCHMTFDSFILNIGVSSCPFLKDTDPYSDPLDHQDLTQALQFGMKCI